MSTVCEELTAGHASAWDRFVADHPHGTFFHQAAWADVLARAFGHRPHFLLTRRGGAVTGVLPLMHLRTRLFGNTLVSTPFCVYGGPLAADDESFAVLLDAAATLLQRVGASALELRFLHASDQANLDPETWLKRDSLYATFRRTIAADDEQNLKAIPRKQRAMVRKGIEGGLSSHIDQDVDLLHRIYAESVRNLGTPVFSRRYFRLLREVFRNRMDVLTVWHPDGRAVASVLNFYWRDEVLPYYGGGTAAARACHANDFMYWEVMRSAARHGCRLFDFGRSKQGTGAFAFKKNWGFAPQPLVHRCKLRPGAKIPDLNPLNPKYRLFIAAWQRLPLPVANLLGPHIVRGIG
jgi:FemAB-related protein (PEP-CTERM system-associated)